MALQLFLFCCAAALPFSCSLSHSLSARLRSGLCRHFGEPNNSWTDDAVAPQPPPSMQSTWWNQRRLLLMLPFPALYMCILYMALDPHRSAYIVYTYISLWYKTKINMFVWGPKIDAAVHNGIRILAE